jgi:hypothetical protein
MESKLDRHLIPVGILAFIGVVLLVAMCVFVFTALVALITGIDGLPQELDVQVVSGDKLQDASVIHLTDRDLKQYPALASAIREAGRDPDMPTSGLAPMTGVESLALVEAFGVHTENRPYLEYDGVYYATRVLLH